MDVLQTLFKFVIFKEVLILFSSTNLNKKVKVYPYIHHFL